MGCFYGWADEQINRELNTRGGLTGITHNENARTKRLLIEPILRSISGSMNEIGKARHAKRKKHHQLSKAHTSRQNRKIASLVGVFEKHGLDLTSLNFPLPNVVTGQVFDEKIAHDVTECEKIGKELYVDRLQEDSKADVYAPLKTVSLKLFTSANKSKKMKVNDRIVELKGNYNRCEMCNTEGYQSSGYGDCDW